MWTLTWRRFRRSKQAVVALVYVGFVALLAIAAPMIAGSKSMPIPFGPNDIDVANRLQPPDSQHRFGTDELGRDVLARMVHGARVSLTVGLLATAIALIVGSFLGAIAGYYGGVADWLVSRLIEVVLCFPLLFLALAIVAFFGPSVWTIVIALGLTSWTSEARFVRGEFLRMREMDFVYAARASGARDSRIIFHHLLPNGLAPVLVSSSFGVAYAILTESALSFLGLGVPMPTATWGSILSSAKQYIEYAWWLVVFPGVAIFLTVAAFNIIGDRFREALDPRSDERRDSGKHKKGIFHYLLQPAAQD
jgi:peptide/nickel transport system permease protein